MQCSCGGAVCASDNFCRHCGTALPTSPYVSPPRRPSSKRARLFAGAFIGVVLALFAAGVMSFSIGVRAQPRCEDGDANCRAPPEGSNADLFHHVGRLFTAEEERQRKLNQEDADAGGNGPKEVSIWCPQEPEVKIVDLGEDERNRDECLVLNINAPNVNSRLVLFCNTDQSGGGGGGGGGGAQWEDTTS